MYLEEYFRWYFTYECDVPSFMMQCEEEPVWPV